MGCVRPVVYHRCEKDCTSPFLLSESEEFLVVLGNTRIRPNLFSDVLIALPTLFQAGRALALRLFFGVADFFAPLLNSRALCILRGVVEELASNSGRACGA